MRLAGITYIVPWDRKTWDRIEAARPAFVVINPASGPGLTIDHGYVELVSRLQRVGIAVLGYVATTWGAKPHEAVQTEAQAYRTRYGADGVFFDEVSPDLGTRYLSILNGKAKSFATPRSPDGKGWAVFNAGRGDIPLSALVATGRALWCTAEQAEADYVPGSRTGSPARELHLVHTAADPRAALDRIAADGIGYGFATSDSLPNPYDTWPRFTFDDATPILGPPHVTVAQAVDTFMAKRRTANGYTRADLNAIFRTYAECCRSTGISFGVALAQVAHETGWLTSWWSARPRHNPSGIGVTDSKTVYPAKPKAPAEYDEAAGGWRLGIAFPDWEHAVAAHVGRLAAYALPDGAGTAAQRDAIDRALAVRALPAKCRGCALTLVGLEGTWAVPGKGYGTKLAEKVTAMAARL